MFRHYFPNGECTDSKVGHQYDPQCSVVQSAARGRWSRASKSGMIKIVSVMNKTTGLSDPFPSKLSMSHLLTIIDTIMHIINLCLSTSVFPSSFK